MRVRMRGDGVQRAKRRAARRRGPVGVSGGRLVGVSWASLHCAMASGGKGRVKIFTPAYDASSQNALNRGGGRCRLWLWLWLWLWLASPLPPPKRRQDAGGPQGRALAWPRPSALRAIPILYMERPAGTTRRPCALHCIAFAAFAQTHNGCRFAPTRPSARPPRGCRRVAAERNPYLQY